MSNQEENQNARVRAMRQQCRVDIQYVKPSKRYALQPAMRVLLGSEIPFEMNSILATSVVNRFSSLQTAKDFSFSSPFRYL